MKSQEVNKYSILSQISSPSDVKNLPCENIELLSEQIREFLIENISKCGGHLASNLGVVELTIALHRVFTTPHDHIIWDVGHQAYVHKILTGRRDSFESLRQSGGLSGFTSREESIHDCFGAGHSSTSLSAALGFAEAEKLSGSDAYTVAVVGDGAFTGGMIHEALNNCNKDLKLIIIINENEMSISKNTGRFANSLATFRAKPGYFQTKKTTGKIIKNIPLLGKPLFIMAKSIKKALKNLLYGSNYFEDIGLYYMGPIDGNDERKVETVLKEAKKLNESVVVHLKTTKGKGLKEAEMFPQLYHSVSPNNIIKSNKTFSNVCGGILCERAKNDKNIIAITAAMSYGTGLEAFRKSYPERFFDVGIAEAHALTFAAGLAASGKRPVPAIYSTFIQRGFDNIIHDIALQNLPVIMCIDRAGLNLSDGVTHHGIFDVAFLSSIPNVSIYVPATFEALERAIDEALNSNNPVAIRYPSGAESDTVVKEFYSNGTPLTPVIMGSGMDCNAEVIIISHGRISIEAIGAAEILRGEGVMTGTVLLEKLTPYDDIAALIMKALENNDKLRYVVFLEEEIRSGGMGMILSHKLERLYVKKASVDFIVIAVDDPFSRPSVGQTFFEHHGLDKISVAKRITSYMKK